MSTYKAPFEEKNGSYYFPDYDIDVVATGLPEAKKLIKDTHGVDVDVNPNPEFVPIVDETILNDTNTENE